MRILHFADLHLGIENYGTIDPATGLHSCFQEFVNSLEYVVNFAVEEGIDAVIFCGDAYRNREPSQTQQREFAIRINKLASKGIVVFLLAGNHDIPNAIGRATTVEIFDTLSVKNTVVASRPGIFQLNTRGGLLQVLAMPWTHRSALLTREEDKNLTIDEVGKRMEEEITKKLELEIGRIDRTLPCIVSAHVSLLGAVAGTEGTLLMGNDPMILPSVFAKSTIDYVALGHKHKKQEFAWLPAIAYSGSLQRIDFGDENKEKGFYVVEIDSSKGAGNRASTPVFHTAPSRQFLTIGLKVPGDEPDPMSFLLQSLEKQLKQVKGAIVRLQITLSEEVESLLYEPDLKKTLREAKHIRIEKNVIRQHRIRMGNSHIEGITPMRALEIWLKNKGYSEDYSSTLLQYGEKLINEELKQEL